jgi:ligand-binding SRPBCC domain-containing protein
MSRQLRREQFLEADPIRVWEFFATPVNLDALTPPSLRFKILHDVSGRMFAGQRIHYRISPLPGVWLRWETEITEIDEGVRFVDEQRAGPYKLWRHEHRFVPEAGGVRMFDVVTYEVGWGPFGWLAEKMWVNRQLRHIFDFRARRAAEIFAAPTRAITAPRAG